MKIENIIRIIDNTERAINANPIVNKNVLKTLFSLFLYAL